MTAQSGVFVLKSSDSLVAMQPAEFATEDDFQVLLSRFPALLVGDQIDPENPRRWILVKREQAISTGEHGASPWSIDHLFLDQDGVPTLVEIKRQSDSRIRREVVGQMLDYAANCLTYWSLEILQAGLESTCAAAGTSSDAALNELIGSDQSSDSFWQQVKTNLIAGRIRLLFIADKIPLELRRIVEFLNAQMDPAEVLAIELRQFEGQGLKTIVPVIYGKTQEASSRKSSSGPAQSWDEESFFEALRQSVGEQEVAVAAGFIDWAKRGGRAPVFKGGKRTGAASRDYRPEGLKIMPVYVATDGKLWLQFGLWRDKAPFAEIEKRRELLNRFAAVEGVDLSDNDLTKYPGIPLKKILSDPTGPSKMMSALEWMDDQIIASS